MTPDQWTQITQWVSYVFFVQFWIILAVMVVLHPRDSIDRLAVAWVFCLSLVAVRYPLQTLLGFKLSETPYTAIAMLLSFVVGMIFAGSLVWHVVVLAWDGFQSRQERRRQGTRIN